MATSLARQLKKLAAPQTTLLKLDKKKPSLLFDPKEAASLDRDVIFDIGLYPILFLLLTSPLNYHTFCSKYFMLKCNNITSCKPHSTHPEIV